MAALVGILTLAGCSLFGDGPTVLPQGANGGAEPSPLPAPSGQEALSAFYDQRLKWSGCGVGECADLRVPLDYTDPSEGIVIKVLRVRATDPESRVGSLVVNPGGPGGSGIDYARQASAIVSGSVRSRYDVVGFDPRGVQRSDPVDCLSDEQLDDFLGADQTPDTLQEEQQWEATSKAFAQGCESLSGDLLAHVSTRDVARDMDILRAALGDPKLTYLGKSYGTYLGAVYAGLFPSLVGRLVLDGVVAPDLTSEEVNLGQAEGFELATRSWATNCVDRGCPFGESADEVVQWLKGFLDGLDATPIRVEDDPRVSELTEGWGSVAVAAAMYEQSFWPVLTDALSAARDGDGDPLMKLANSYARRGSDGSYDGNIMEVIYAVNCVDKPSATALSDYERMANEFDAKAPIFGRFLAWSSLPCADWPVPPVGPPEKISAQGSAPIVVIGTTRDPATPYEWSVRLGDQLADSALVSFDGDGHTAYKRGSECVDKAVDDYFVRGTVPQDGLKC